MRKLFFLLMICLPYLAGAQAPVRPERKGFTAGFSLGAGLLSVSTRDTAQTGAAFTFPNLRIGYLLREDLALCLLIPGSVYRYQDKPRGFEGVLLSAQYWPADRWWLLGGAGMALDAPAFWTVREPRRTDFHTGFPALAAAAGFELWRSRRFALDLQYRFYTGRAALAGGGQRRGWSQMGSIGFNWY
ncbi:MAG: hypothetical protein NW241_05660 [Bacteroidia bacterium]|nr:hypothetical protein [Bacteroidia bacterium]